MNDTSGSDTAPHRDSGAARRVVAGAADVALWLGSILGACALVLILLGLALGVRPLIFRSGSMSPSIPAGSLGLSREVAATGIHRGDVVTVPIGTSYVTHRVVDLRREDSTVELRLRGDANNSADPQPYHVRQVGKLLFSVPGLGYPVSWLSHPPGVFVLAGYAAIMLAVIFRRGGDRHDRNRHDHQGRHASGDRRPGASTRSVATARHVARVVTSQHSRAVFGVLLLGTAMVLRPSPSWAAFTDKALVSGSTIKAYTVPTTTLSCGALGIGSVTFNWTKVAGATSYTLHYGANGATTSTTTATSRTLVTLINGGTAWVTVNRAFDTTTWSSAASNKRTYTVAVVSLCS